MYLKNHRTVSLSCQSCYWLTQSIHSKKSVSACRVHILVQKGTRSPTSLLGAFQRPWTDNLPPRSPNTQTRPNPVLVVTSHIPILMDIPSLPWAVTLSRVPRNLR